jgi:hypothetical protein
MSQGEIEFNALAVIVAVSETLTTALCGALYYLVSNTSYQTLAKEIRLNFPTEKQILAANVKPLPHLDAVFNEVLRLCPPIPDNMRREVPKGGATVAGHHLPEGTIVGVSCWSMFQSSSHFSNPEKFSPERSITNGKDEEQRPRYSSFFPFSLGPHGCIWDSLILLEVRLLLALFFFTSILIVHQEVLIGSGMSRIFTGPRKRTLCLLSSRGVDKICTTRLHDGELYLLSSDQGIIVKVKGYVVFALQPYSVVEINLSYLRPLSRLLFTKRAGTLPTNRKDMWNSTSSTSIFAASFLTSCHVLLESKANSIVYSDSTRVRVAHNSTIANCFPRRPRLPSGKGTYVPRTGRKKASLEEEV